MNGSFGLFRRNVLFVVQGTAHLWAVFERCGGRQIEGGSGGSGGLEWLGGFDRRGFDGLDGFDDRDGQGGCGSVVGSRR